MRGDARSGAMVSAGTGVSELGTGVSELGPGVRALSLEALHHCPTPAFLPLGSTKWSLLRAGNYPPGLPIT